MGDGGTVTVDSDFSYEEKGQRATHPHASRGNPVVCHALTRLGGGGKFKRELQAP